MKIELVKNELEEVSDVRSAKSLYPFTLTIKGQRHIGQPMRELHLILCVSRELVRGSCTNAHTHEYFSVVSTRWSPP